MHHSRRKAMRIFPLLALLLPGCTPTESQVERAIVRELPRLVGPAQEYQVDVQGLRGTSGADRVTATGQRVQPTGAPVLDRVDVGLGNVAYNAERGQLERIDRVDVTARVLATDLAAFFEAQRNLRDVTVTMAAPNRVTIRARPEIPNVQLPAQAVASLTGTLAGSGPRVLFQVTEATAAGFVLPQRVTTLITDTINPVVDLSALPVGLTVNSTRVDGSALMVQATGSYTASP